MEGVDFLRNVVFTHLWFLAQDQNDQAFIGRIDMMTNKIIKLNLKTFENQSIQFEIDEIDEKDVPKHCDSTIPFDSTIFTTSKEAFLLTPTFQIFRLLKDPDGLAISQHAVNFPWPTRIVEVSSGNDFVVFRDVSGNLFSMGTGTRGELGVGLIRRVDEPVHIEELAGIQIKKVACGGWHCLALAEGDDVYGWGWNRDGQLGEDKMTTEMFPTLIFDPAQHSSINNILADMSSSTIIFDNNVENVHFGKQRSN